MAKILEEGCVAICGHCTTRFSFELHEVKHSTIPIPPGYSPEEEGHDKSIFKVECPKCHRGVDVENKLGPLAKKGISAQSASSIVYHDL